VNRAAWLSFSRLRALLGPMARRRGSERACPTLADLRQTIHSPPCVDTDLTDVGFVSLAALRRLRPLPRLQP
jgi:hypothetical protein